MITITDISFWQSTLNPQTMKAAGANGTILRAGQGTWKDTKFDEFRAGVRPLLPFGSYWYYDNRYAPTTQADLYASILGSDPGIMGAWLDLEDGQIGAYGTWQHWQAFIERFRQKQPNVRLGIYTRASYIDSRIPSAQHTYFKQFDLWVAHYGVTNPAIPKAWSTWLFHQYTSTGDGKAYGVGSASIDLNRYNGTVEQFNERYGTNVTLPPADEYQKIRRYESDAYIALVDPKAAHVSAPASLERTSTAASRTGSKFAINGDGWNLTGSPVLPLSLAYSNGRAIQTTHYDTRPFLNITQSGAARISHTDKTGLYNTVSGTRWLVQSSIIPPHLFGTEAQYTARHPRTAVGINGAGELILCVVDGRTTQSAGVTLVNLARIMLEFGAVNAIELDGGGSSTFWYNGSIRNIPSDGGERWVVNHLLVGAQTMTTGTAREKLGKTSSIRNQPDVSGGKVGEIIPRSTISFVEIVPGSKQPLDSWLKLRDGQFVNLKVAGIEYYDIISNPTPDPDPEPEPEPEPTPEVPPLTVTVTIKGTGYKTKVLEVDLEPDGN